MHGAGRAVATLAAMRRARIALPALILALAAVPAAAAGSVTWIVKGGGFGHGVGMSAYGAHGYGLHGAGYRQILHHYFKGIRIGEAPGAPQVRVLLDVASGEVAFSHATSACGQSLDPSRTYTGRRRGASLLLLSGTGRLLTGCGGRLHADGRGTIRIAGVGVYRGALEL